MLMSVSSTRGGGGGDGGDGGGEGGGDDGDGGGDCRLVLPERLFLPMKDSFLNCTAVRKLAQQT